MPLLVGRREEDLEPVGRLHLRLEIDDRRQQPHDLCDHRLAHSVGEPGPVDAVIEIGQVALHDHRDGHVVEGVGYRVGGRRRRADDEAAVVVAGDGDDVVAVGVDAGAHDAHVAVGLFDAQAQDVALRQRNRFEQARERVADFARRRSLLKPPAVMASLMAWSVRKGMMSSPKLASATSRLFIGVTETFSAVTRALPLASKWTKGLLRPAAGETGR